MRLPGPAPQPRWKTFFRLFLALPAIALSAALGGGGSVSFSRGRGRTTGGSTSGALALATAILGWFASVVGGRMPKGLRDAGAYSVGYSAPGVTTRIDTLAQVACPEVRTRISGTDLIGVLVPARPTAGAQWGAVRVTLTDRRERTSAALAT